jgi:hypothetical protein
VTWRRLYLIVGTCFCIFRVDGLAAGYELLACQEAERRLLVGRPITRSHISAGSSIYQRTSPGVRNIRSRSHPFLHGARTLYISRYPANERLLRNNEHRAASLVSTCGFGMVTPAAIAQSSIRTSSLTDHSHSVLAIPVVVGCSAIVSRLTAVSISDGGSLTLSAVSCIFSISSSSLTSQTSFSSCCPTRFHTTSSQNAWTLERSHHLDRHCRIRSLGSHRMGNPFHLAWTTTRRRGREDNRF